MYPWIIIDFAGHPGRFIIANSQTTQDTGAVLCTTKVDTETLTFKIVGISQGGECCWSANYRTSIGTETKDSIEWEAQEGLVYRACETKYLMRNGYARYMEGSSGSGNINVAAAISEL